MTRQRPAPQTAAQAQECIDAIWRAYKSDKARRNKVHGFLRLDDNGFTNWTPEARKVWESVA